MRHRDPRGVGAPVGARQGGLGGGLRVAFGGILFGLAVVAGCDDGPPGTSPAPRTPASASPAPVQELPGTPPAAPVPQPPGAAPAAPSAVEGNAWSAPPEHMPPAVVPPDGAPPAAPPAVQPYPSTQPMVEPPAMPIRLSTGVALPQTGMEGIMMGFSVEYECGSGHPNATSRYGWVIQRARGEPAVTEVQLQARGTLQMFAPGWRPDEGPFQAQLIELRPDGTRRPVSDPVALDMVGEQ
ncbi:MAG: hypothetical protein JW809_00205 [Pirellulales bacterium]|nr:hypothetical protein [Pirellulales bacterium]